MAAIVLPNPASITGSEKYDGTTSLIPYGNHASQQPIAQTTVVLCFPTGSGEVSTGTLWSVTPAGSNAGVRIYVGDNAGAPNVVFHGNSTGSTSNPARSTNGNTAVYNSWNHIAATWDGSLTAVGGIKIYNGVNWAAIAELVYASGVDGVTAADGGAGQNLTLGNRGNGDRTFLGSIAYIARWNRVLSLTELLLVQERGPGAVRAGMILCLYDGRDYGPYRLERTARGTAIVRGPAPQRTALGFSVPGKLWDAGAATDNPMTAVLGTETLTGLVPSITQGNSLTAVLGTETLTGLVPSITQGNTLASVLGTETLTGLVPSFAQGQSLIAVLGTETLTGLDPTFSQTAAQILLAELGTATLTGLVPVFSQPGVAPQSGTMGWHRKRKLDLSEVFVTSPPRWVRNEPKAVVQAIVKTAVLKVDAPKPMLAIEPELRRQLAQRDREFKPQYVDHVRQVAARLEKLQEEERQQRAQLEQTRIAQEVESGRRRKRKAASFLMMLH